MKYFTFFMFSLFLFSCGGGEAPVVVESINGADYQMEEIPGQTAKIAKKVDSDGDVLETGQISNGLKNGTWLVYDKGKEFPKKIETFVGGAYNGPYFELNERGQITLATSYKNNKLNGEWATYKFGRAEESATYKDGQLDGVYKSYYQKDGKIQKEFHYKKGQLDGPYRFYNEEGVVTLEYTYRKGEKVGGGIVNPEKDNAPK